jgi:hypothetical protein
MDFRYERIGAYILRTRTELLKQKTLRRVLRRAVALYKPINVPTHSSQQSIASFFHFLRRPSHVYSFKSFLFVYSFSQLSKLDQYQSQFPCSLSDIVIISLNNSRQHSRPRSFIPAIHSLMRVSKLWLPLLKTSNSFDSLKAIPFLACQVAVPIT